MSDEIDVAEAVATLRAAGWLVAKIPPCSSQGRDHGRHVLITRSAISSGRCHGPGCTQTARTEFFCSEVCQLNWDRQAAGLAPVKPWPPSGYVSPVARAGGFLIPAVERAAPEIQRGIERLLVDHVQSVPVTVAVNGEVARDNAPSMVEAIERAAEMVGEMTSPVGEILRAYDRIEEMPSAEPIKLTRAQLDAIRVECPPPPLFPVPGAIDHLMGRRIELVDTEEESTLYRPPVEVVGVFEAFDGDRAPFGPPFGPLPPAVDGSSEERTCQPDPERGWLTRALHVLYGRTT